MTPVTRRQLLAGTAAAAAGAAVSRAAAATRTTALPSPGASGIENIVFLCMENRSFDHFLGWLPGADGRQAGLVYKDDKGVPHATHRLTERQGCGFEDPDHSYRGGHLQLAGGKMNGFRKGKNDDFALGYYTKEDLPFYSEFVNQSTVFDHWFCSTLSQTYPNRMYTHAARTDRENNTMRLTQMPTIWDRLKAAGVPSTYYFSDLPFLALWGEKHLDLAKPVASFFAQALSGTLPAFSYVEPFFLGEDQGGANDDHPHSDIHRGQAFLSEVCNAIALSPQWKQTVLIITYDEWGGFFDHVRPPKLPDDHVTGPGEYDHGQAGFRVPTFMFSPFARRGHVEKAVYDHTSMLKLVEWRFGLAPLSARDKAARNPALALDFARPNLSVPSLPVVLDPGPHVCGTPLVGMAAEESSWLELRDLKNRTAWKHIT
jgi:phospholipase C